MLGRFLLFVAIIAVALVYVAKSHRPAATLATPVSVSPYR
jgi:hypothetical protein